MLFGVRDTFRVHVTTLIKSAHIQAIENAANSGVNKQKGQHMLTVNLRG